MREVVCFVRVGHIYGHPT